MISMAEPVAIAPASKHGILPAQIDQILIVSERMMHLARVRGTNIGSIAAVRNHESSAGSAGVEVRWRSATRPANPRH